MRERGSRLQRRAPRQVFIPPNNSSGHRRICPKLHAKPAQLGARQRCERQSAKSLGGDSIEASKKQAARDSNYNIDKFVLSLRLAGCPARLFTSLKPRAT